MKTFRTILTFVICLLLLFLTSCSADRFDTDDNVVVHNTEQVGPSATLLMSYLTTMANKLKEDFIGPDTRSGFGRGELVHVLDIDLKPMTPILPPTPVVVDTVEEHHGSGDIDWESYYINNFSDCYEQGLEIVQSLRDDPSIPQSFKDTLDLLHSWEIVYVALGYTEYEMLSEEVGEEDNEEITAMFNAFIAGEDYYYDTEAYSEGGGPRRAKPQTMGKKLIYCAGTSIGLQPVMDLIFGDVTIQNIYKTAGIYGALEGMARVLGWKGVAKMLVRSAIKKNPVGLVLSAGVFLNCLFG